MFDLDITEEMLRKMEREEGRAEGLAEGLAEGRAEGREEERTRVVNLLMESMHLSRDEALKMIGCPEL